MLNLRRSLADGRLKIRQHLLIGLEIIPRVGNHAEDVVVGCLQIVSQGHAQILQLLRDGLGCYLIEFFLDLILNRGGSGVGNLRRYRVPFLVYIILDLRGTQGSVLNLQQIRAEGLRNHDGRVIFSRFYAVYRILLIGKYPAQIVVLFHLVQDLLACVQGSLFVLCPHVIVGYGHLNVCCVAVRVAVRRDIEPRVQRRDDTHSHGHNDGRRGFSQPRDISFENLYHFLHCNSVPPLDICFFTVIIH